MILPETRVQDKFGIHMQAGSLLERSCAAIQDEYDKHRDLKLIDPQEDVRSGLRECSGVIVMFQRLQVAERQGKLTETFRPHLQLLSDSLISQASTYEEYGIKTDVIRKQNSDKLFELVVALAAAQIGTDVQLEDPTNKQGHSKNPDVLVKIDGILWGFPCKVISGKSEESWFNLIKAGVDQIGRSPAERGCVIVNLRNLFDHDLLNPAVEVAGAEEAHFRAFPVEQLDSMVKDWVIDFHRRLVRRFDDEDGGNSFRSMFLQPKTVFGFLGYLETVAMVAQQTHRNTPMMSCWYLSPSKILCPTPNEILLLQQALVTLPKD